MSLSDLFKKKPQEENRAPGNPTTMIFFRILAVGYVAWIMKDLVVAYKAGGADAPSLKMLIITFVAFGAGIAFIVISSIRHWKQMKADYDAYNEQVAADYAAEEAAKLAAEQGTEEENEEILELPETEEE